MKKISKLITKITALTLLLTSSAFAVSFKIENIKIVGLKYVSHDAVLKKIPFKVGDTFSSDKTSTIIKNLYQTNFFDDVKLFQDNNTLVIKLTERPIISTIDFSGNKAIPSKQLREALKKSDIAEGSYCDSAKIYLLKTAIKDQYINLGYADAIVDIKFHQNQNGGVNLTIAIQEGSVAKVKGIHIIGNKHFSTWRLKKQLSLKKTNLLSFLTSDDQYSDSKLATDLENLKNFYLDNGYIDFRVVSQNHEIVKGEKSTVKIAIVISEGQKYKFGQLKTTDQDPQNQKALNKILKIKHNADFSRQKVIDISKALVEFYGSQGFAFTKVEPSLKVDKDHLIANVLFEVTKGKRAYVNHINFSGNTKTSEVVLRKSMTQMESAVFNAKKINESTRKLNNLGYLSDIKYEIKKVDNTPDLVDINYSLTETSSATASLNVGYSDTDSFLFGASLDEQNFLGTGKYLGVQFTGTGNGSSKSYSIDYADPFFTNRNLTLSLGTYANYSDQSAIKDLSEYSIDSLGFNTSLGIPLSDYTTFNFGLKANHYRIHTYDKVPVEINQFINKHGRKFSILQVFLGYTYSNLDRAIFPTDGFYQSLSGFVTVPGLNEHLDYYKLTYNAKYFYPLTKNFVFMGNFYVGFGDKYGKLEGLPFFENFYAGGLGSVRGYQTGTLGPRDSNGDALGGNLITYMNLGVAFPNPLGPSVRTSVFFDAGNVFTTHKPITDPDSGRFKFSDIRYSAGVQLEWRNAIPMTLSLGVPLNKKNHDKTEIFQFSLSTNL